jgi:hypothetical protein
VPLRGYRLRLASAKPAEPVASGYGLRQHDAAVPETGDNSDREMPMRFTA